MAARKEPMQADTKDCCHVKPTVTRADPVFQPTRENWLENQYKGKLNLLLSAKTHNLIDTERLTKSRSSAPPELAQDLCLTIFHRQSQGDLRCPGET
jgi:hypothetical protein